MTGRQAAPWRDRADPVAGPSAQDVGGAAGERASPPARWSRLEDAGLNASAPPQQRWLDGWLLRYCPAKAQRARCVNALAEGVLPLDERLGRCRALYAAHSLPFVIRITPFTQPASLDARLAARGFAHHGDSLVMTLPRIATLPAPSLPARCRLQRVTTEAYAHIVGEFRGTGLPGRLAHAQRLAASPVPYTALLLRDDAGAVLAGAQAAQEGELVGLYDVFTREAYRNRGLAGLLCRQLLADAHATGAETAYLQVEAGNAAARAVYRRLGFVDAYRYHYRSDSEAPT
ncbi:MAG: GNAT family N-acetyltransferase [Burkholderiales bacterium]|nr:GNAT family N-acetyltransferase [Burkholderiales bacterium]